MPYEDTCMPYEEEDTCMPYEEEDTYLEDVNDNLARASASNDTVHARKARVSQSNTLATH